MLYSPIVIQCLLNPYSRFSPFHFLTHFHCQYSIDDSFNFQLCIDAIFVAFNLFNQIYIKI
jgi:hypothetical protein